MIRDLIEAVPEFACYPSVADLDRHLDALQSSPALRVTQVGLSAEGHPIRAVHCEQQAPRTALLWGYEDPSEPICGLSTWWLCDQLAQPDSPLHRVNCNWMVIPCLNPDGARRNEHWFARPGDLRAFFDGSWEPPIEQIMYWNPPPTCSEMRALRETIAACRPDLLFWMHDESHFFGPPSYEIYLSEDLGPGALTKHLAYTVAAGMPLSRAPSISHTAARRGLGFRAGLYR